MKNIVAHSLEKLYKELEELDQNFLDSDMKDMDAYEKGLAEVTVLVEATRSSYSRAATVLGKDAEISKTAVMNKVYAIRDEIPFEKPAKKKCVEYLYIEADEDHIHKQEKTVPEKKTRDDRETVLRV